MMQTPPPVATEARVIEEFENHFFAEEVTRPWGRVITVHCSPMVDKNDPLWDAVREAIGGDCYENGKTVRIPDDDYYGGHSYSVDMAVYRECPRTAYHICKRKGTYAA